MKQFFTIFKFEFCGYLKNKVFVGTTIAFALIIAAVLCYPRVAELIKEPEQAPPSEPQSKQTLLVSDKSSENADRTAQLFQNAMPDKNIELTDKSIEELRGEVDSGNALAAVVITGATEYTYVVKSVGIYDSTAYEIEEILRAKYREESFSEFGVSGTDVQKILETPMTSEVLQTGKDQTESFFYTYILIFALYMAILLYGQFVATSVATEKSSRAMELLITSARPKNLMFGKVVGSGLAGLAQLAVILGSAFVFFNLNKSYWADNAVVNSVFNMPIEMLLYTFLFFILGFFLYAFMFGAIGSMASKVEDINTSSMPLMFVFIIAFMIVMFSMSSGNVDSTLMIVASYVPLTSPMAMFTRIAMGDPSGIGIVLSIIILVGSTVLVGLLSAKIYKIGVLMYGTPPKIRSIIKAMKNDK